MANYDLRAPLDFRFGQLSGSVTSLDTTLTSTAFTSLPSDLSVTKYMPMTLADDALGVYETVWVTGHAAGSTAVTVIRGREDTAARAWATGAAWRCAPTVRDAMPAYTRAALPADGHLGMRALVTDESVVAEKDTEGWTGGASSTGFARYRISASQNLPVGDTTFAFGTAVQTSPLVTRNTYQTGHSFTLNRSGLWALSATIRILNSAAAGERYASWDYLDSQSNALFAMSQNPQGNQGPATLNPSGVMWFPKGTVVRVGVWNGTGAALTGSSETAWNNCWLAWLRG